MSITSEYFGRTKAGQDVYEFTITNENGTSVSLIEYGCAIKNILFADKDKTVRDVVLGYNTLEDYESGIAYHGAFVGRCANRIKGAQFMLDNKTYTLEKNNGENHLHGTFSSMVFKGNMIGEDTVVFKGKSKNGDDGFPGKVTLSVKYTLTIEDALVIEYLATTDDTTIINLTNHSYFNLGGHDSGNVLDTELLMRADKFTPSGEDLCPTGEILNVADTPMDFTAAKKIGADINSDYEQLVIAGGYDHNFIFAKEEGMLAKCAVAANANTGIQMKMYTTQPAVQLYTGNFLADDTTPGKHGKNYNKHEGFCLETQHYPCTPSHGHFPSITLNPGEEYHHVTTYKFSLCE